MQSIPEGADPDFSRRETLADLFPDGDFRFHLTLRRGEPREFFRPQDETGRVLAERVRWLTTEPVRYAAFTPDGEPLLAEFAALCAGWSIAKSHAVAALGSELEADFLLLSPDAEGGFR